MDRPGIRVLASMPRTIVPAGAVRWTSSATLIGSAVSWCGRTATSLTMPSARVHPPRLVHAASAIAPALEPARARPRACALPIASSSSDLSRVRSRWPGSPPVMYNTWAPSRSDTNAASLACSDSLTISARASAPSSEKYPTPLAAAVSGIWCAAAVGSTRTTGRSTPVDASSARSSSSHPGLNSSPPTSAIRPAILACSGGPGYSESIRVLRRAQSLH